MWKKASCAIQGRSHIANNIPCQDKTYCLSANDVEVIALADGAGSAKLSHYGAEAATQTAATLLSEQFDQFYNGSPNYFRTTILTKILDKLLELQKKHNCHLKDLSSTLLIVAIKDTRYIIAQLGDGVIGYIKNDQVTVATKPQNGEFANTTYFTTSSQASQIMTTLRGKLGNITGFVLMSDGSENSFYNKRQHTLAPIVKELFDFNTMYPKAIFQTQLENDFKLIISQKTSDDCSIALINNCNKSSLTKVLERANPVYKYDLFRIMRPSAPVTRRRIKRFEMLLRLLADKAHSLQNLARAQHLKDKYMKKQLDYLISSQLLEYKNGKYYLAL